MNSTIAVVTDSDASLPVAVAEKWGIRQVPITVHFGEEVFRTGIDIDDKSLFERIDREGQLPTTAAPSPGDFASAFKEAAAEGAQSIICFCVSSKVSATYEAARAARDLVEGVEITVVDTESLSMGQGFMVLAAAETIADGGTVEQAVTRAQQVGERTHLYAGLSTLEYLAMSGRVGHLAAGMANLLSIKPILSIQEGKLDLLERVRTQRRAWNRMVELVQAAKGDKAIEKMALVHVDAGEDMKAFGQFLCGQLDCPDQILEAELTPGLSVHAGAGVVGVAFVTSPHS